MRGRAIILTTLLVLATPLQMTGTGGLLIMIEPNPKPAQAHVPPAAAASAPAQATPSPAAASAPPAASSPQATPPVAGPVPSALRASSVPANAMDFDSPAKRLDKLVDKTMNDLYEALDDKEFKDLLHKLRQSLDADKGITAADLTAHKQEFLDFLAELHAGEQRVYPDRTTTKIYDALMEILEEAAKARGNR